MIDFYVWAKRWNLPAQAIEELKQMTGAGIPAAKGVPGVSEKAIQSQVRVLTSQRGAKLMRNNSGAMYNERGVLVRFGLGNDSAKSIKVRKSSDLIGFTPYVVQPVDLGRSFPVFTAYEIKRGDWVYKATPAEQAQLNFINFVVAHGGIAKFVNNPDQI